MPIISQRGTDERGALLPPMVVPLFDDVFIASFDLCEEFVARTARAVLKSTGLAEACQHGASVEQALSRAELDARIARVPVAWLLSMLASRGFLSTSRNAKGELLYRVEQSASMLDPDEFLQAQQALDARCLPSYQIVTLAAAQYPAVLRGESSGEQAMFGAEGISAWVKYFSNDNPLYAISNAIGALAARHALADDNIAVLEIGGGLGSGADALIGQLGDGGREIAQYRFTEISPLFLKRAQRTLSARHPACPFTFAPLDIDRPFAEQGVKAGTQTLVYGVNVLHVARDLAATLNELKRALAPGGLLVMSECMRPLTGQPLHVEFVFNLLSSFRDATLVPDWRPNGGFLTPEQWRAALSANGFADIQIFPDVASIREAYPSFSVAAIVARRL
ncbi:MAG: class I SAM-dependent methyltransferase [Burkholderiales bacterium]